MKTIATVSKHDGLKTYLTDFHGQPVRFQDQAAAEKQISLLSMTCGYNYKAGRYDKEPQNFGYVIENA